MLTPRRLFAAWAIYTSSRTALLLFDDCVQLRQALAELTLRRSVELRWADSANVLRCNGEFSRDSAHRTKDFALPSYDEIEILDDTVTC